MAADPDDASRLVAKLLDKLAALDNKVQHYRKDMAQEFQRYSREILQDVPQDVASKVEQAVADSLHNHPALEPGFTDLVSSLQSDQIVDPIERIELDRKARAGSRSPPPVLPHTSGVPREHGGQRSPHEREREFHGLFTPSYLPLLEAVQRNGTERKSITPTLDSTSTSTSTSTTSSCPSSSLPHDQSHSVNVEPNNLKDSSMPSSSSLATVTTLRPDPTRRHTEDTLSSITSDDSASRSQRRSALRRSSSSSTKTQSPRRVRFEVEGGEVLPTMSPMMSPRLFDLPSSPSNSTNVLSNMETASQLPAVFGDENLADLPETDLLGSSPPAPKKVSSTDRLKALARSSTEDTSKWTVVGDLQGSDDEEDELVMGGRSARQRGATAQAPASAQPAQPEVTQIPVAHRINDTRLPSQLNSGLSIVQQHDENPKIQEDEGDSSDSDELTMPAKKSSRGLKAMPAPKAPFTPPRAMSAASSSTTTATSKSGSAAPTESNVDEEDMFDFDDEGNDSPSSASKTRSLSKYIEEEGDDVNAELDTPATPIQKLRKGAPSPLYSASRSVQITRTPPPPKSPSSGLSSGLLGTSMGSYKGRSIMLGSVKNEQLHEEASKMGNFTSFVGSVDGRTGVDEKGSYRHEGVSFSGTPKSLSERMLKEDLEEEEAARHREATTS